MHWPRCLSVSIAIILFHALSRLLVLSATLAANHRAGTHVSGMEWVKKGSRRWPISGGEYVWKREGLVWLRAWSKCHAISLCTSSGYVLRGRAYVYTYFSRLVRMYTCVRMIDTHQHRVWLNVRMSSIKLYMNRATDLNTRLNLVYYIFGLYTYIHMYMV